jgi:uncharacterized protein (DUF1697 family)
MAIYVALLRGINVGGHNKIKMADLRAAMEAIGLERVQTYIQSGNILFESSADEPELRQRIEQQIEAVFGLSIKVVLRSHEEIRRIAAGWPFSEEQMAEARAATDKEVLYVSMLLEAPQPEKVEKLRGCETGGDRFVLAGRDMYLLFDQSIRNSKLSAQVEKLGVPSTVRNSKTIRKLLELMDEMAGQ